MSTKEAINQGWVRPSTGMEVEEDEAIEANEIPTEDIVILDDGGNATITIIEQEQINMSISTQLEEIVKPKKTRTRKPQPVAKKASTPEELIAAMEGKIQLLKIINGHSNIEIPKADTLKLAQRELLIGYQQAIDKVKDEYVQLVSNL